MDGRLFFKGTTYLFLLASLVCGATQSTTGSWVFLELDAVNLTAVAHSNNQDTILISSVGSFTQATVNGSLCQNATYFINASALEVLAGVIELSTRYKMSVFIGLLDVPPNLPDLWGPCMATYAQLQGEVAALINSYLTTKFGNYVSFSWYMAQQPGLDLLQYQENICVSDGLTTYYMAKLAAVKRATEEKRATLISPYWMGNNISALVTVHNQFMACTGIDISAPQDGVGSLNRTVIEVAAFFYTAARVPPPNFQLWASIDTFLPKDQLCNAAPAARIAQQISAVSGYVQKIINFWAFNLPGAPTCITPW